MTADSPWLQVGAGGNAGNQSAIKVIRGLVSDKCAVLKLFQSACKIMVH
jgi:Mg/Co/Ni transporter MgtE